MIHTIQEMNLRIMESKKPSQKTENKTDYMILCKIIANTNYSMRRKSKSVAA